MIRPSKIRSVSQLNFIRYLILMFLLQAAPVFATDTSTLAPTFYLTDLKGDDFFASKVYGEKAPEPSAVIFSFFATWCIPCRGEVPQLEILAKEFPGIQFYLVSVKDKPELILRWLNDLDVELPVLVDRYGRTAKKFKVIGENSAGKEVASLPSLFVINKAGKIVYQHTGYKPGDEQELKQILENID